MKKFIILLFIVVVAGCSTTPPTTPHKRDIKENNQIAFENPEIRLKISDDLKFLDERIETTKVSLIVGDSKYSSVFSTEYWIWDSISGTSRVEIEISPGTGRGEGSAKYPLTVPGDFEYYRSFPDTIDRGGKKYYLVITKNKNEDLVVFTRDYGTGGTLRVMYYEMHQPGVDWEELLNRADATIEFLSDTEDIERPKE